MRTLTAPELAVLEKMTDHIGVLEMDVFDAIESIDRAVDAYNHTTSENVSAESYDDLMYSLGDDTWCFFESLESFDRQLHKLLELRQTLGEYIGRPFTE